MKTVTFFYKPGCPYCKKARKAMEELCNESTNYSAVVFDEVNENAESSRAAQYNYYYVPSFFIGDKKLYEARPWVSYQEILENIRRVMDAACM